jgi:hypothetical protein
VIPQPSFVYDYERSVVIAQGAPTIIMTVPPPGYPGRRPAVTRHPTPAVVITPVPSAVVVTIPAPGIIRMPYIAIERVPDPSAMIIGAPITPHMIRHPDVGVVSCTVFPAAIAGQLVFIVFITVI